MIVIIAGFSTISWADSNPVNTVQSMDSMEYQLELRHHKELIVQKSNRGNQLNEFTTDGCSGGLSVGWQYLAGKIQKFQQVHGGQPPWESCCIVHDQAYHTGGGRDISAKESFMLRKQADKKLEVCVRRSGAGRAQELSREYGMSSEEVDRIYDVLAALMYRAVRVGGIPCTGLPWRWGYGWPECD